MYAKKERRFGWHRLFVLFLCLGFVLLFAENGCFAKDAKATKVKKQQKKVLQGWVQKNGQRYYYSAKGYKTKGWKKIDGNTYYFEPSGRKKGQMATGWKRIGKQRYYFRPSGKQKGSMVTGWRTIGGKRYYFVPTGAAAGQAAVGWKIFGKTCYYFGKKGVLQEGKTVDGNRGADKTGSAHAKTLRRAQAIVSQITTDKMAKEQKLRACFDYVMRTYTGRRPRTPHYYGKDWPTVYANDMFLDGSGNCFSYAAAFAYLARACGYQSVYACNSTGHGWTEIDGKVYDPEQYRNTPRKYYGTDYSKVPGYWRAISDWSSGTLGFKRVRI